MDQNKSSNNKAGRTPVEQSLSKKTPKLPTLVPPVLKQVSRLAAGVANVSSGLLSSGSSTGNPRNKTALQPGHSLMDWIRLGASGKDLTGVGAQAGKMKVTKQELSKHNTVDDIWLAIRGKVFNVTFYVPFHPGGEDEIMRGAGIDATSLFEQVHPWVNYDQILQKCLIGRLVSVDPGMDATYLFNREVKKISNNSAKAVRSPLAITKGLSDAINNSKVTEKVESSTPQEQETIEQLKQSEKSPVLPRFDWIQRLDFITIIFYTEAFSNPLIEIVPPNSDKTIVIIITYGDYIYTNEILFYESVVWPGSIRVAYETGKIEIRFQKAFGRIWENYGVLRQQSRNSTSVDGSKYNFMYKQKINVIHNIVLIELKRTDGCNIVVPLGKHVRAFVNINGVEWSRSYTPVPDSLFTALTTHVPTPSSICLMIKRYENGNVSRYMSDRNIGDIVYLTKPFGEFDLKLLENKETFLLLAAGSGITPMFNLLIFLLERTIRKCQFVRLLFFNRTEEDIPFRDQLGHLENSDPRLRVTHVLSHPDTPWIGLTGYVTKDMIEKAILEHIKDTGYTINNIFTFICGPNQFVSKSIEELKKLDIIEEQMHVFQG